MFESITTPLKTEVRDAVNYMVVAIVCGLSAAVAFMFGAVAVFIAAYGAYGSLYASLAEIGYCALVIAIAVGIILVVRSKARRRAAARGEAEEIERRRTIAGAPPPWRDAGVLSLAAPVALKALQFGLRNKASFALVTTGLVAAVAAWQATKPAARNSVD